MGGKPRRAANARPIILALPKGRVLEQTVQLFVRAGYRLGPVLRESRRLVHECGDIRVLVVRAGDVPTYVEYGAADIGVAGRDVLEEEGRDLYEPVDLGIGACRMVVAEPVARPVDLASHIHLRVATKYPGITMYGTMGMIAPSVNDSPMIKAACNGRLISALPRPKTFS